MVVLERASQALRERVLREVGSILDDDGSGLPEGNSRFEAAWERYLIAEQRARGQGGRHPGALPNRGITR